MKKRIREYLPFALFVLCLFAARSSLADHYLVPSGSMERALYPGDRIVVDKRAYGLRAPFTLLKLQQGDSAARGDVVVFDSPVDGTRLIKRVVALGGDLVEVRGGRVRIHGRPDEENSTLSLASGGGPDFGPARVPPGEVLVLGDARGNSNDGRFFGFVPQDALYAKAMGVYYRSGEGFVWMPL
jgi:signal peptidase I